MSLSMGITDRKTGAMEDVPVCTTATFRKFWLPAAKELGLEMIQALGALEVTAPYRERFLAELHKLDHWVVEHLSEDAYFEEMRRRIETIIKRLQEISLDRFEVFFG